MFQSAKVVSIASIIALLMPACSVTKFIPDDQALLVKNKIHMPGELNPELVIPPKSDMLDIIKQQPNTKTLGLFRLKTWFYLKAEQKKLNRFRNWMKTKVGEPPVIYDSTLAARSVDLLKSYLKNKGFFYADVSFKSSIKNKKARVTYFIEPGKQFKIDKVIFPASNEGLNYLLNMYRDESHLKPGSPFDVDLLKLERTRISNRIRDHGYFYFNPEYVYFELDSTGKPYKLDVYVNIRNATDTAFHRIYYINKIIIYPDYSIDKNYKTLKTDTIQRDGYYIVTTDKKYKPKILISAVHLEPGKPYKLTDHHRTLSHLIDLGTFKFINIKFKEFRQAKRYLLDCHIYLTPAKKQELAVEAEVSNSSYYDLGSSVTFTYLNKNLFRGCDLFSMQLTGSLESQFRSGEAFFNTSEVRAESRLTLNRFIVPFKLKNVSKNARPKTIFMVNYSFLRRLEYYSIHEGNFSFGYDWKETFNKRHLLNPVVIKLIQFDESRVSDQFLEILNRSPFLRASFQDQLIPGLNYTYILTSKYFNEKKNSFLFRGSIDLAGNLVQGVNRLLSISNNKEKPYQIFGINYSQYVRLDGDFRYYFRPTRQHSRLVLRSVFGIGVPYGNSTALPYIKSFFAGGANSMRAWRIRTLGPGSFDYTQTSVDGQTGIFFDQTGDIKLEFNAEYRFDIIQFLKGAVFLDAGNIWILKADTLRPGADFAFDRFYREIALNTGVGIRFDFSYFVIRFDIGLKLRDPVLSGRDSWVIRNFDLSDKTYRSDNFSLNLAIGYPF